MRESAPNSSTVMRARVVLASLVGLVALLMCRPANADDRNIDVRWIAPDVCPRVDFVHAEVARLLGPRPSPQDKAVSVEANVSAFGKGWRADIATQTDDAKGRRTLTAESCHDLARATALVVAMMVNAERVAANVETDQPAPTNAPPPVQPNREETPAPIEKHPPANGEPLKKTVGLFATGDFGTVPSIGYGIGIAGGVIVGRLRVELFGAGQFNHDAALSEIPGLGATFRTWSGGARACGAVVPGDVEVSGCAAFTFNYLEADSFGVDTPRQGWTTWSEPLAGGAVRWAFAAGFGLRLEGYAGFPLPRRAFVIAPLGVVHTLPTVTGHGALGVDVRF